MKPEHDPEQMNNDWPNIYCDEGAATAAKSAGIGNGAPAAPKEDARHDVRPER